MSNKPTLLFIATHLTPYGGANTVIAWSLQALKDSWDITILCADLPDFEGVDKHYGTQLSGSTFKTIQLALPVRHLEKVDSDPFSFQRASWSMRKCQAISHQYDAVFAGEDEWDFGRPGVMYTHYPYMDKKLRSLEQVDGWPRWKRFFGMTAGRVRPWLVVSGMQASRVRQNRIITNSHWTAGEIESHWNTSAQVVYPPVKWSGRSKAWDDRRIGFASIGRIDDSKRLPDLIRLLSAVRARGFDIEYDIIGDTDLVAGESYLNKIKQLISQAGDWVRLNHSVSRDRLEEIISNCRFGIHGMHNEHFGIGVAEMVRAGCIVFVHDSGGQVEIVGDHPLLRYSSEQDAVDKICQVLSSKAHQGALRSLLSSRADELTSTRFMEQIRDVMAAHLDESTEKNNNA